MEVPLPLPRRMSSDSSSPEFEFWMVGNNLSSPQPLLLTADELFVDGVLLPLHLLSLPTTLGLDPPEPEPNPETEPEPNPDPEPAPDPPPIPSASICSAAAPPSGSRRWKDIFKVSGDKSKVPDEVTKDNKQSRKERKSTTTATGGAAAELSININIWPFSRSRSAGNKPTATAMVGRKSSSAPCSRSNSRGESAASKPFAAAGSRRWAASPGRVGVHLGRTSPVWQLRRPAKAGEPAVPRVPEKAARGGRKGGGVLSLNVNTCIGYGRNQVTCRGEDNDGEGNGELTGGNDNGNGNGNGNGSLFNLRTLFSKKVY